MEKKLYKKATGNQKYFKLLYVSLLLTFIFIMSGCATSYTLELADRKASPSMSYTNLKISKVRSAAKQKNNDISVCMELYEPHKADKSRLYEFNMPGDFLLKKASDLETLGFRGEKTEENLDGSLTEPFSINYFYPLEKAKKGCKKNHREKLPADSILPIMQVTVSENEKSRLYALLSELRAQEPSDTKLFEVKFLKDEDVSNAEMNGNDVNHYSDVLLIYWPSDMDQELVDPIGITGGYESEDESTNLYYLLVPPALVIDAIGLMIVAAAHRPM